MQTRSIVTRRVRGNGIDSKPDRSAEISFLLRGRSIQEERNTDATFQISVSIVEIYNEICHDLLAEGGKRDVELAKTATGFAPQDLTSLGTTPPHFCVG